MPPLLVIVGETATGKSDLAMFLAEKLNGEIINADSWSARKYFDIGTAKPTVEERRKVKHHLIDIAEPDEDFTVADFKPLAEKAIKEVSEKGKLPILVGGSGLYIDSILYNYSFLKAGDRAARDKFNSMSLEELINLTEELKIEIPKNLDRRNKRRVIRLIESDGELPKKGKLRSNTVIIGLKQDASLRRANIEKRVDAMLSKGLENEVRSLASQYGWDCEAMLGVGYRQWANYLKGSQSLEETRTQIVNATINLAKKQITWFKRNKSIQWFDTPVEHRQVVAFVTTKFFKLNSN